MANINRLYPFLISMGAMLLVNVTALKEYYRPPTTTTAPEATAAWTPWTMIPGPDLYGTVSCQNANAMLVDATLLKGEWFEAAHKPTESGHKKKECVKINLSYTASAVFAQLTYSDNSKKLSAHKTVNYSFIYDVKPGLVKGTCNETKNGITTFYKILESDYKTFALACEYSVRARSDGDNIHLVPVISSGAHILTRKGMLHNQTFVNSLEMDARKKFYDFRSLENVIQSSECHNHNGAGGLTPGLGLILVFVVSAIVRS